MESIGVTRIDYSIISHYHKDHIGCAAALLTKWPVQKEAIDRGFSYYVDAFTAYANAVGTKRKQATTGMTVTLDSGAASPVKIHIVTLNAPGVTTQNENDLSLVAVVRFGQFDVEIGGDLSGQNHNDYHDIETSVAPLVGQVEVYKVHHHGSSHSSNAEWLRITKPKVGIISCGIANGYTHPHPDTMEALHLANVKTYWTTRGDGAEVDPAMDVVGSNIVVQAAAGAQQFTVTHNNNGIRTDTYPMWGAADPVPDGGSAGPKPYWWTTATASRLYHYASCSYVNHNSTGWDHSNTRPQDRQLHTGCPR